MDTSPHPQPTLLLDLGEVATQLRGVHLGRSVRVGGAELDRFVASMRDDDAG